ELQVPASTVRGIGSTACSDFGLVAVANGQQHVLGEIQVAPLFAVVFVDMSFHDGIHWTAFFAETAEDALGEVDVVARSAAGAVLTLRRLDRNRQGGTDRFAQLAGNASLFAIGIATQRVQTTEPGRSGRLLMRIPQSHLALEEIFA